MEDTKMENLNPQINQQTPNKSYKLLWSVAGVLVLVAIAGAIYWWQEVKKQKQIENPPTEQQDETANWKTYENNQYGYIFKYPANLKLTQCDSSAVLLDGLCDSDAPFFALFRASSSPVGAPTTTNFENISVDGEPAKKFVDTFDGEGPGPGAGSKFIIITLTKDGYYYAIEFIEQPGKNLMATFDKILSTFKFNPHSRIDSLDNEWNLYTNYEHAFSIKVPKQSLVSNDVYGPVEMISYKNSVFITNQYDSKFYQIQKLIQENKDNEVHMSWNIFAKNVNSDQEIDSFIKKFYGSTCSLGAKIPTSDQYTFNIQIAGGASPDVEGSDCFVNYVTVMMYSTALRRLVVWDMGQAPSFMGKDKVYDEEMRNSFKFIE